MLLVFHPSLSQFKGNLMSVITLLGCKICIANWCLSGFPFFFSFSGAVIETILFLSLLFS